VNVVDVLVLVLLVAFATAGLRQGFVVSVVSFVGFVVGGLVGLELMPWVLAGMTPGSLRSLVGLLGVVLVAVAGQALAGWGASVLRERITWRPARRLDAAAGGFVGVVAVTVAVWLLGGVLVGAGGVGLPLAESARDSRLLAAVDDLMPGTPDQVFDAFGRLLDTTGFPEVFSDLTKERPPPVAPPDSAILADAAVRTAAASTVKIVGDAQACDRRVEGSGFVYAPGRVMTNAHVVAGVESPVVYVDGRGRGLRAQVVAFDPRLDVAVLRVPDLELPALRFAADPAAPRTPAAVIGYPGDGPLTLTAARVRGTTSAIGQDVYGEGRVVREIYSLRAQVRPGNSGGPLVAADGTVLGVVFAASREDPETGYALTAKQVAGVAAEGVASTTDAWSAACG
jgi:S1-C subfamily serine protease